MFDISKYSPEYLQAKSPEIFAIARESRSLDSLRQGLAWLAYRMEYETFDNYDAFSEGSIIRVRDCARALCGILTRRSEDKAGFSVARAIYDISLNKPRPDLTPAFYAELLYLLLGLQGRGPGKAIADVHLSPSKLKGRSAAKERSRQLDEVMAEVNIRLKRIATGLSDDSVARRKARRKSILAKLGGTQRNWNDWKWHIANIVRDPTRISQLVELSDKEQEGIQEANRNKLPFGITPHYLSLMDDDPESNRDRSIRAQVLPPPSYVEKVRNCSAENGCMDFMKEADTSPIDLVTRRYPAICIFKPFNTCPQICVYCQRNWEIEDAMMPDALAPPRKIDAALEWIRKHPAIHEVLVTGGDPLAMTDPELKKILDGVAAIPSIERIRIGSRVLVTLPMRITDKLTELLASYRIPGKRQVAIVTHVQHPYELTPETLKAVKRLRARGIPIYNQLVYTFFASRRFEAAWLRRILTRIGIEPYYTFNTKGKEETNAYRVPIARLLQEQKEEARLLPGLSRTDEAVFNVPGLGKNYLRASQHRELVSVLPDGARVYEFHPWEKQISNILETHIAHDVPILEYLQRLDSIGEDASDYDTIWYYY